jgi:hypothetical protein
MKPDCTAATSLKISVTDKQATIIMINLRTWYLVETTSILANLGLRGSFESKIPSWLISVGSEVISAASNLSREWRE